LPASCTWNTGPGHRVRHSTDTWPPSSTASTDLLATCQLRSPPATTKFPPASYVDRGSSGRGLKAPKGAPKGPEGPIVVKLRSTVCQTASVFGFPLHAISVASLCLIHLHIFVFSGFFYTKNAFAAGNPSPTPLAGELIGAQIRKPPKPFSAYAFGSRVFRVCDAAHESETGENISVL